MKQINDPGSIDILNLLGDQMREPVIGPEGYPLVEVADGERRQKTKPSRATLKKFALGLLATPEFIGEAKGLDAAALVFEARNAISAWPDGPGPKLLENEYHRGLVRAVKESKFDQTLAHNLVPYMRAITDAPDAPPVVAVPITGPASTSRAEADAALDRDIAAVDAALMREAAAS